jgi:hypothetical protein
MRISGLLGGVIALSVLTPIAPAVRRSAHGRPIAASENEARNLLSVLTRMEPALKS